MVFPWSTSLTNRPPARLSFVMTMLVCLILTACSTGGDSTPTLESTDDASTPLVESGGEVESSTEPLDEPAVTQWGEPYDADGATITVQAPAPEDISAYDMPELDGIRMDIAVTNDTDAPVDVAGNLGFDAFSGTAVAEYLICDDGGEAPSTLQPGRTAEWSECYGVEDADDVIFNVYPPNPDAEPITFGVEQ